MAIIRECDLMLFSYRVKLILQLKGRQLDNLQASLLQEQAANCVGEGRLPSIGWIPKEKGMRQACLVLFPNLTQQIILSHFEEQVREKEGEVEESEGFLLNIKRIEILLVQPGTLWCTWEWGCRDGSGSRMNSPTYLKK